MTMPLMLPQVLPLVMPPTEESPSHSNRPFLVYQMQFIEQSGH